jgi:hypothetical protein
MYTVETFLEEEMHVIVFQVALCIVEECVGISVVWCAYVGFLMKILGLNSHRHVSIHYGPEILDKLRWWTLFILAYGSSLLVYYFVAEEMITTVAHICAIILGWLIGTIFAGVQHLRKSKNV